MESRSECKGLPKKPSASAAGGLWDASARMGLSSPHHQCTLASAASQVCGSGFMDDASHSCIFCGVSAHSPLSFCSNHQENLGPGADPVSPPHSHNTPMGFPSGGLAQENQTSFRSSSLLRLSSAGKWIFLSKRFCLVSANWVCGGWHGATREGRGRLPCEQGWIQLLSPGCSEFLGCVQWLKCTGHHCWCSSMVCYFAAACMARNPIPRLGSVHAPQGTPLQRHITGITHWAHPSSPKHHSPCWTIESQNGLG